MSDSYDVVVIGGGPAGLAAAIWLARYRLRTILFDNGDPRNAPTWAVHGYFGIEDPSPQELRQRGREQAMSAGAEISRGTVMTVEGEVGDFHVRIDDGRRVAARRVLFATGLRDIIPEIQSLREFYGTSIWHCADCDGPGVEGLRVGVIGSGRKIAAFCMQMLTWTDRLTILTHGRPAEMTPRADEALARFEIPIRTEPIARLEGREGLVQRVVFDGGEPLPVDALFFHIAYGPACSIPAALGCEADEEGALITNGEFRTTVPGIYAAGDITHGSKLAIQAAADGTRAAVGIYRSLMPRERKV